MVKICMSYFEKSQKSTFSTKYIVTEIAIKDKIVLKLIEATCRPNNEAP